MKTFYISDLHLFHKNVIDMCKRPYDNIEDMHEDYIKKWNSKVGKDDVVRILGDIAFPKNNDDVENVIKLIKKLNGNKTLIVGNHDHKLIKNAEFRKLFSNIESYMRARDNGRLVILFHYPIEEWDGYYRGSYHLYGHIHGNDSNLVKIKNRYNVCIDVIKLPCTLDELIVINCA